MVGKMRISLVGDLKTVNVINDYTSWARLLSEFPVPYITYITHAESIVAIETQR